MRKSSSSSKNFSPKRALHFHPDSTHSQNGSKSETSQNFLTPKGVVEAHYSKALKRLRSTNPICLPGAPSRKQKHSVNDSKTTNFYGTENDELNLNNKEKTLENKDSLLNNCFNNQNSFFPSSKNLKRRKKANKKSVSSDEEALNYDDREDRPPLKFKFEPEQPNGPDNLDHIIFDPPIIKQFSLIDPPLKSQKQNCLCHKIPLIRSNSAKSIRTNKDPDFLGIVLSKKERTSKFKPHKNLSTPRIRQKSPLRKASFELDQTVSIDENKIELGANFGSPQQKDQFGNYLNADESNVETIVFKRKNEDLVDPEVSGPVMFVASGFTAIAVTSFVIVKGLRNLFW